VASRVFLGTGAQDVLRTLHPKTKKAIRAALRVLKENWPQAPGLDLIRMRADPTSPPVFRLRVGDWRIVLRGRGADLEAISVFHREEGYGWMERE